VGITHSSRRDQEKHKTKGHIPALSPTPGLWSQMLGFTLCVQTVGCNGTKRRGAGACHRLPVTTGIGFKFSIFSRLHPAVPGQSLERLSLAHL
jgi:hypothetical protein